jgi:hypothetical protein
MSRPIKHKATATYYLRIRTPSDLLEKATGRTVMLSVGPKKATVTVGDAVKFSLQTKDQTEAKVFESQTRVYMSPGKGSAMDQSSSRTNKSLRSQDVLISTEKLPGISTEI